MEYQVELRTDKFEYWYTIGISKGLSFEEAVEFADDKVKS